MKLEAENYKVPISVIIKYTKEKKMDRLNYLEYLADSLELPVSDLIEADEKGNLEDFLKVEQMCYSTFKKLDQLYSEEKNTIQTKIITENEISIKAIITQEDLEAIKKVVKNAYKVLIKQPLGSKTDVEQVICASKHYRILAQSTQDSLKLTALFGKYIGHGGAGVIVRSIDLLTGEWATGDEAVLKIPNSYEGMNTLILRESQLINKIHVDGQVLGIQRKLKVIKNVLKQENDMIAYHQGCLYETDLSNLLRMEFKKELKKKDKASITYQLLHGVCHIHNKDITHLDIKPENIFCNFTQDEIGPRIFLADFGGSIDHSEESLSNDLIATTPEYSLRQDEDLYKKAELENNRELYKEIQKKADIFATCSVICSLFTGDIPYALPLREVTLRENLQQQLEDAGLSPETIKLLIQGLNNDYQKRPDARTLFEAIQNDMKLIAPQQLALLQEQSLTLN